jgi:hypothetical protein
MHAWQMGRWPHARPMHACMHARPGELAAHRTAPHRGRQLGATQGSGAGVLEHMIIMHPNASKCTQCTPCTHCIMHPMHSMHARARTAGGSLGRVTFTKSVELERGSQGRNSSAQRAHVRTSVGAATCWWAAGWAAGPPEPAGPRVGSPRREAVLRDARACTHHGGEWARACGAAPLGYLGPGGKSRGAADWP